MLATDAEIRETENERLAGMPEDRRLALVEHAVELHRQARNGMFRCRSYHAGPRHLPDNTGRTRPLDLPLNIDELKATCIAEACRVFGVEPGAIEAEENRNARLFALVALTNARANHNGCKCGILGPKRAQVALGIEQHRGDGSPQREYARDMPFRSGQALTFGSTLRTRWETR